MTTPAIVPCPQCQAAAPRADERCAACGAQLALGHLEVGSGPLRGRRVPVYAVPFTIGRASDNDLPLPDLAVSRLHARIQPDGDGLAVEDLESRFGVYVDGSRVKRAGLGDSARLKIGDTLLEFTGRAASSGAVAVSRTEERRDLLLTVLEALGSTLEVDEVLDRVVDGVMRVSGAERGFLLLNEPDPAAGTPRVAGLALRVARGIDGSSPGTLGISSSVVNRVRSSAATLVTGNAARDPELNPAESVMNLGLKTIICIPLVAPGGDGASELLGVIYADNQSEARSFSPESVKAAEALSRHAALAIHNAQLYASERRANRAKGAFLAAMSHELHTPLNAIIGYGEMIEERARERDDADDVEDVRRILDAGEHLLRLVNDVLDMSQLESGHMQLKCEVVELRPLLREALDAATGRGAAKGLVMDVDVPSGLRARAEGQRLVQVVKKLVDNAVSFTSKGRVRIEARPPADGAAADGEAAVVEIVVADDGAGMTAEQAAVALEAFVQVDSSTTRSHGGMGLGLPLSRRLCEAMGGSLVLETSPGRGTTVRVRLPSA